MEQLPLYTAMSKAVDAVNADVEFQGSMEGLNSTFIGRMFVSIIDTFGGLLKTASSNLFKVNKSIKRSELNEFTQSNTLKMRTVDKIPYESRIDIDVDVPANMKETYKVSVTALIQVYTKISAVPNVKLGETSFREILTSAMQSSTQIHSQIESLSNVMTGVLRTAKPAVDFAMDKFNGKFEYKRPYQEVFLSNDEWKSVREDLIGCESRLQDVRTVAEAIDRMEGTLREIAKLAEDPETILTQKDLKNLGEAAKGIALILDAYGMATTRQMAMEHNYILCANHLYEKCK